MLPIFERPEVPGIINDLTLPILRFTPDGSHYIGLILAKPRKVFPFLEISSPVLAST